MMLAQIWTAIASIPADALKVIGGGIGAAIGGGVYLYGRLSKLPTSAEPPTPPRHSLSETDRELGFTLIRTGTDLTKALNDHGELLKSRRRRT